MRDEISLLRFCQLDEGKEARGNPPLWQSLQPPDKSIRRGAVTATAMLPWTWWHFRKHWDNKNVATKGKYFVRTHTCHNSNASKTT
jgi:hypothetical protein